MLYITVPSTDLFDERTQQFVTVQGETLMLEHSLVSLSKWEENSEKPFLGHDERTREEIVEYIRCMTISPVNNLAIFDHLTPENFEAINTYIDRKMTATWFNENPSARPGGEIVTAEIVYYWMITLQVPMEMQYWHFNKLLTQIKVINLKNAPKQKVPAAQAYSERSKLNAARLAAGRTRG